MSVSNEYRNFWKNELVRHILAKVLQSLREAGKPDLLTNAKAVTRITLVNQIGITNELREIGEKEEEVRGLEAQKDFLNKEIKALTNKCDTAIDQYYVDPHKGTKDYWRTPSVEEKINELVEKQYILMLRDMEPPASEVADLLEAGQNIERTIMLATTQPVLVKAIMAFCSRYGIKIEADLL